MCAITIHIHVLNQNKESNYISHLVYYFTLSHMHLRDREILTKGFLTLTLMPYLFIYLFLMVLILSFVALFARVLKSLGCFLTRCPKTVRFGSHKLKARYMGRLESLIKRRNNTTKNK